jgi:glutaconate CoA-transferase subunit A
MPSSGSFTTATRSASAFTISTQPDGGRLRDRPPPRQGPAPGGALNGQALDVLIGAGCVRRLDIAYGGGGRFAPTCIRFRKAVEPGRSQVEDYTNNMMVRFLAGALNAPFIPSKSGLRTDVVGSGFPPELRGEDGIPREKVIVIDDPFGHEDDEVVLLRAHARRLDHPRPAGEHRRHRAHQGLTFATSSCKASTAVIVTCEEIVPESFCGSTRPERAAAVPGRCRGPVPIGAHPPPAATSTDYDPVH